MATTATAAPCLPANRHLPSASPCCAEGDHEFTKKVAKLGRKMNKLRGAVNMLRAAAASAPDAGRRAGPGCSGRRAALLPAPCRLPPPASAASAAPAAWAGGLKWKHGGEAAMGEEGVEEGDGGVYWFHSKAGGRGVAGRPLGAGGA